MNKLYQWDILHNLFQKVTKYFDETRLEFLKPRIFKNVGFESILKTQKFIQNEKP